jgi:hypothetical protein
MDHEAPRLRKILTPNDTGTTGSHQAGIVVPKSLLAHFPTLDPARLNPDEWLDIASDHGTFRWRFIHYNNRVVARGTRDEFRLTHIREFLRRAGASTGDALEFERTGFRAYWCRVIDAGLDADSLVLSRSGPWRVVSLRRR